MTPPVASSATPAAATAAGVPSGRSWVSSTPLLAAVAATVTLMPLLVPAGPGNTAAADVTMAAAIVVTALALSGTAVVLRLPYSSGVALLALGGLIGAVVNHAPVQVVLVVVQDVVLLLWCWVLAHGRHDPRIVEVLTRAWCRTTPAFALLGVLGYLTGVSPLSGVSDRDGARASYTLGDPNLAGNYLVLGLLVMFACRRPVQRAVRWPAYGIVLTALAFTGSNGGLLSLLLAVSGCIVLGVLRHNGTAAALLAVSVCVTASVWILGYVAPRVDVDRLRAEAAQSIPLLRDSIGRSGGSTSERAALIEEGTRLWFEGDGTGFGPARTKATLQATQAPYVKEAHNDYLAVLLERGPVGGIGLVLLFLATGSYLRRLLGPSLPGAWGEAVPRAWALVVAGPVIAVAAMFYEVLHFRHVWTWLGLVAALALVAGTSRNGAAGRRP